MFWALSRAASMRLRSLDISASLFAALVLCICSQPVRVEHSRPEFQLATQRNAKHRAACKQQQHLRTLAPNYKGQNCDALLIALPFSALPRPISNAWGGKRQLHALRGAALRWRSDFNSCDWCSSLAIGLDLCRLLLDIWRPCRTF